MYFTESCIKMKDRNKGECLYFSQNFKLFLSYQKGSVNIFQQLTLPGFFKIHYMFLKFQKTKRNVSVGIVRFEVLSLDIAIISDDCTNLRLS